jgi:DnaJ-class molecular chaperone
VTHDEVRALITTLPVLLREPLTAYVDAAERNERNLRSREATDCTPCKGSGTVWVGEDEDRPMRCSSCNGRGRR